MKILAIDKNAVIASYQKKWEMLAGYEDVEVTLLAPKIWIENFNKLHLEENSSLNIIAGKAAFPGYENRGFYYTALIKAVKKCKPDIIHIMEEPFSIFMFQTILAKKLWATKAKIVFYTYDNLSYDYKFPYKLSFVYKYIELFTFKNVDYGLCANEEARNIILSKGFANPVKVLYPCFDLSFLKKRETGNLKSELGLTGAVIGFIGRIIEEKGLDILLKACSKLNEAFSILIIGNGNYKNNLIKLSNKLGISEKVKFIKGINYNDIPKYLSLLDIFVLPSKTTDKWKEQFGRVIIEAMACGVPVIGSSSGAIPEVIGDNGLIFKENDYNDLKNKILLLIKDIEFRNKLKALGENYSKNFSVENYTKKIYRIYNDVLNN